MALISMLFVGRKNIQTKAENERSFNGLKKLDISPSSFENWAVFTGNHSVNIIKVRSWEFYIKLM